MLRQDGWRVEFLGADTPADAAIAFAERSGATMLCVSASRRDSVAALRKALATATPHDGLTIVLGGAAITPAIARELRGLYADEKLDTAVARLRKLARSSPVDVGP